MTDIAHIFRKGVHQNIIYAWFPAMYTRVDVVLVSNQDEAFLLDVVSKFILEIDTLEQLANCFSPERELSKYNTGQLELEQLDKELREILLICEKWRIKTDGMFDVNVEGRYNLSGFLKGYALDKIRLLLADSGIENALVNMGNSSVMALGMRSEGKRWTIVNPETGQSVELHDECLTTSGNDTSERRHIINPKTKQFVTGKRVVSVITPTGSEGEARSIEKFLKTNNYG